MKLHALALLVAMALPAITEEPIGIDSAIDAMSLSQWERTE